MPQEAERDRLRDRVLGLGRSDERVRAGALTASTAGGPQDRHSDVDVAFALVPGADPGQVLDEWSATLDAELGILHHWDLPAGTSLYRVFLLEGGLELDVGLVPADRFGAFGPRFELGDAAARDQTQALACIRLGLPSQYARGVDRLPSETAGPHSASLVRSLDPGELRRALAAALDAFLAELRQHDGGLADRLEGPLRERTG